MINIIPISEWKCIFFDTSFVIECLLDPDKHNGYKQQSILCAQKILRYIQARDNLNKTKTKWVTSSIVISELNKLNHPDALNEIMGILQTPEVEIINFTIKEAYIVLEDFNNFVEGRHFNSYISMLRKAAAENDIFNPKCILSSDAKVAACAKSKYIDVILTSDKNTFTKLAYKVQLPVLLLSDIVLDMYGEIDSEKSIRVEY